MKTTLLLITCLLLIQCKTDCPDCPEPKQIDSAAVCNSCYYEFLEDANSHWDSVKTVKMYILDSLHNAAMQEVTQYRESSIYQIDTMRENYLSWCADTLQGINRYFDSLKKTKIYDNLIIHGNSIIEPEGVYFDSTGKPFIRFK